MSKKAIDQTSQTIRDAQSFIESVKKFQKQDIDTSNLESNIGPTNDLEESSLHNELTSSLFRSRNNSSSLIGISFPSDLEDKKETKSISKPTRDQNLNTNPSNLELNKIKEVEENKETSKNKDNKNKDVPYAFPTITFSRKHEYEDPFRADLLTFIEIHYYENKKLPSLKDLATHFKDHPKCPKTYSLWQPILDDLATPLANRGIRPYNTADDYIDPRFAYSVSLIVNYLDKRTIPGKLKEAGLSTKDWQAFLRRKRYFTYFQNRLDEVFDQDVKNEAKLSLARSIQNGDLQAIKYYNELKNIYRPETQNTTQMISIILTAVMEILSTHVTSEVLNAIAAEIRSSPSVLRVINTTTKELG